MLSEEEKLRETKRRRGAGSFQLPHADGKGAIACMIGTETELRSVSAGGVYRVLLPEDIDPEVTTKNVTWMVQRELHRGASDPIIGRTLGQIDEFQSTLLYNQDVRQLVARHGVSIAKSISNVADQLDQFRTRKASGAGTVTEAGPSAIAVEPLAGFDASCRSFFIFAKGVVSGCTGLLVEGFGLNGVHPGSFKFVVDALEKVAPAAAVRLRVHDSACKKITDTRNAIEHPEPSNWFETRNYMLAPGHRIMRPTFCHHAGDGKPAFMDFENNAENVLECLIRLAEHAIVETAFHNCKLPWGVEVQRIDDAVVNPQSPFRYRATIGSPPPPV